MFNKNKIIQDEIWLTKISSESTKSRIFTLSLCLATMTIVGLAAFFLPGVIFLKSFIWAITFFMDYNLVIRIYALLVPYKKVQMWDRLKEKTVKFG